MINDQEERGTSENKSSTKLDSDSQQARQSPLLLPNNSRGDTEEQKDKDYKLKDKKIPQKREDFKGK